MDYNENFYGENDPFLWRSLRLHFLTIDKADFLNFSI